MSSEVTATEATRRPTWLVAIIYFAGVAALVTLLLLVQPFRRFHTIARPHLKKPRLRPPFRRSLSPCRHSYPARSRSPTLPR